MICTLSLLITVLMQTRTLERTYAGAIVSVDAATYTVDFTHEAPWLGVLAVPKHRCQKA